MMFLFVILVCLIAAINAATVTEKVLEFERIPSKMEARESKSTPRYKRFHSSLFKKYGIPNSESR
ncbi:MAG TPA: hypothetical protein VFF26_13225 [Gallionella sp.]|nr:hypothetical protein [Gallionella sp.]